MNLSQIYIAISIAVLAIIAFLFFLINKNKKDKKIEEVIDVPDQCFSLFTSSLNTIGDITVVSNAMKTMMGTYAGKIN
ncbi:MAG: hypothetical protein V1859_04580 [archaeon]